MNDSRTTGFSGWMAGLAAVAVWGLTFVSTDALLSDFTPMEILLGRLAFAIGTLGILTAKSPQRTSMLDHLAMAAMALTGIVVYQYWSRNRRHRYSRAVCPGSSSRSLLRRHAGRSGNDVVGDILGPPNLSQRQGLQSRFRYEASLRVCVHIHDSICSAVHD